MDIPALEILVVNIKLNNLLEKEVIYLYPKYRNNAFCKGYEVGNFVILSSNSNFRKFNKIGYYSVKVKLKQNFKTKQIFIDEILNAVFLKNLRFENLPICENEDLELQNFFIFSFNIFPALSKSKFGLYDKVNQDFQYPLFFPFQIYLLDPYEYFSNSSNLGYSVATFKLNYIDDKKIDDIGIYSLDLIPDQNSKNEQIYYVGDNVQKVTNYAL